MTLYEDLKWRGLIHSVTDEALIEKLNQGGLTFYLGTDPTADSLHIGHLEVFLVAKRLEQAGHKPILLIGGATGFIGDPRQSSERSLLSIEQTNLNAAALHKQVLTLFNCEMVNNYDWISKIDLLTFLRTYGKLFNVNYMINKETVKARLDSGISFTEFSYQLLQALDFAHLYHEKNCILQMGGQDQWGNITSGIELIRKLYGADAEAYGFTSPLVMKSDGTKFGKSESGTVWLDAKKTSPYAFYQYFINTADNDVITRLKQFTFLSHAEIEQLAISVAKEPHLRLAQKVLAKELTILVHGEAAYDQALRITESLFSGKVQDLSAQEIEMGFEGLPTVTISDNQNLIDVLVMVHAASSKREAREFISNGAVLVNGQQEKNLEYLVTKEQAIDGIYTIIRRGKKNYYLIKHA